MGIIAKTTCANCGTSYLPVNTEYSTGFDTTEEGTQRGTVTYLGVTETFHVTMAHEEIDYNSVKGFAPAAQSRSTSLNMC